MYVGTKVLWYIRRRSSTGKPIKVARVGEVVFVFVVAACLFSDAIVVRMILKQKCL